VLACHAEERAAFCSPPRNTASAAPQNQANCTCRKSCVVGCEVLSGVAPKSPLKVKVQVQTLPRRITCGIRPTPPTPLRSAAKSSKLQRPKICMVGCEVLCGVGA